MITALVGWMAWATLTCLIGTRLLPQPQTRADVGQLLRTLTFSSAPGVLCALGVIPFLGSPIYAVASVWMLVAMIVAVRQALDYTEHRPCRCRLRGGMDALARLCGDHRDCLRAERLVTPECA